MGKQGDELFHPRMGRSGRTAGRRVRVAIPNTTRSVGGFRHPVFAAFGEEIEEIPDRRKKIDPTVVPGPSDASVV